LPSLPATEPDPPVIVVGGEGRLGSAVMAACRRRGLAVQGKQAADDWPDPAPGTVVFDASSPDGLAATTAFCRQHSLGLVCALSGLTDSDRVELAGLGETVAVVLANNLSLGHYLQLRMLRWLAGTLGELGETVEASVWERHARTKQHRPSASAVELAQDWAASTGGETPEIVALRSGHPVSEHSVSVDWPYESLTVHHDVRDLRVAATGALLAISHIASADPGLVRFDAVLDERLRAA